MSDLKKSRTRCITMAAVASALGVILLSIGALLQVLDLSMAALASLTVVFGVIELRGKYPYLIYAVTAVLSMLLVPVKTAPLVYLLFAGYYPILKALLERYLPRAASLLAKVLIFNLALFLAAFLSVKLFMTELPAEWLARWWLLFLLTPVFLLYDLALTRLITAYLFKWRARLRFLR